MLKLWEENRVVNLKLIETSCTSRILTGRD